MLNIKNTLDGYLKNVEVIGNTVQDANNLADICSVGDKVEGQELYNISIQVDNGEGVSEVVEILSPVQLEKVGDVVDRIVCKDGVWGIKKNVKDFVIPTNLTWNNYNTNIPAGAIGVYCSIDLSDFNSIVKNKNYSAISNRNVVLSGASVSTLSEIGIFLRTDTNLIYIKDNVTTLDDIKLKYEGSLIKYPTNNPTFIPLPQDQQVKLRIFAGQTNIAFLTEIPGQIKAQVPKSLGATVNTHTEQIADLHNSLDRVKKLEETTVSTIETGGSFTTIDATSNGYFEDVKLEGKTLVNLSDLSSEDIVITKTSSSGRITPRLAVGAPDKLYLYFNCKRIQNLTYSLGIIYSIEYVDSTPTDYLTVSNGSTIGHKVVKITPKSGVKNITITIHSSNTSDATATISDIMLMSLKDIDEHNPPSYFKGLMSVGQDVEEVSVASRNVNLYNVDSMVDGKYIDITTGDVVPHASRSCSLEYIPITKNTLYFNQHESIEQLVVHCYDINKTRLQYVMTGKVTAKTLVLPEGTAFIRLAYAKLKAECKENGIYLGSIDINYKPYQSNKKPLLYYNPTTETWEKPVLREWDTIEKHSDGKYYYHQRSEEVDYISGDESLTDCITDMNKTVKKISTEKVYECTNIDLMTYSGETNYIINSGAISPKSLLKVHNNISNVVKILQEKVSLLENTFIAGLKSVLSGDMYSLATILYPEDFEQNDNTEQDIMVIPE